MRVGMDISQLAHRGGVATYTDNLSKNLSEIKEMEMVYFYSSLRKKYQGKLKNVKSYKFPPSFFEVLFNRWRNIPIEKFIGDIDVFHSSDWTQPKTKAKKVTTYHDIVPLKYPKWSHPKIVAVHKKRLELVEQEIDVVISVSQSTKKDLIQVSRIPQEKIKVIYEAPTIDSILPTEKEKLEFRAKYKLPEKFFLAIGGIGERRNLDRIKEACKDYNLVISGQTIPWLEKAELKILYSCAQALVYCSLYEGFGIPILDAFSIGCPVITSNLSSMPEIAGNAALFVNPLKIEEIQKKLKIIDEDKSTKDELVKKGFQRVKEFSWEKTASQTAEVYKNLVR